MKKNYLWTAVKAALLVPTVGMTISAASAQTAPAADDNVEIIEVRGIVSSLRRAMSDKKESIIVSDGIAAEDLGKFPDLNVAESLQRITGVSIDRSGGEGQAVTVRGFGPQFNTVLVNGRQLATDSSGREFNFDVLAADQITGADVYKSTRSDFQEGGIGATINVSTARPFDYEGFQVVGSIKGMYETLSEDTSPSASVLVSNTFSDDKVGVLLAVSRQERDVQINRIETLGWRPGLTLSNKNDGVLATDVYLPRNWDQIVDQQERTRTNASLVVQFAPTDEISITVDGFLSKFEVDSTVNDLASWFEPDRVGSATVDAATGTALAFTQEVGIHEGSGDPSTDFVSHTRNSRDTENTGFGINVEWDISEKLKGTFDVSTSDAENDQSGKQRFNVIGFNNNYSYDSTGSIPTVAHDGFTSGSLPATSLMRAHYNERNGVTDTDEITELKADFQYTPDSDVFTQAKFGMYRQEREKSSLNESNSIGCDLYCGYNVDVPDDLLQQFTANNYFSGLIDTFYAYDGEAYFDYLEGPGLAVAEATLGTLAGAGRATLTNPDGSFGHVPFNQNNGYLIKEDITSLYMDFTFMYDLGDMPVTANFGARYSETDIQVTARQSILNDIVPTNDLTLFANVLSAPTEFSQSSSYSNLLPSVNVKLEIEEDMVLRFSVYDSITRPTMSQLSPSTVIGQPRRQSLTASGGNPALEPFKSENWDVSFEWYYGDASFFTFAIFNKEVEDFIITLTGPETFGLADRANQPGFRCSTVNSDLCAEGLVLDPSQPDLDVVATNEELNGTSELYSVTRPQNGDSARVTGYEIAVTHVFDNGFGFAANATVVNSNASLSADTTQSFALEGLGDSQNLIGFYETDNWQARVAFNNREGFLRLLDNGFNGEPINTETFGQWDVSGSYDINENFTVFIEGINVTEEELVQTGRFGNQIFTIEDNGARYAVGVRGKF
jgi:iron complex outermembrane receptor protein